MLPTRNFLRKALSWFVIVLGITIGFLVLVLVGEAYLRNRASIWLVIGFCLCLAIVFIYASFCARRNRRRSGLIFLVAAPVFVSCSIYFNGVKEFADIAWIAGFAAPFLLFGLFWLGTHKRGWPALVTIPPRSIKRRLVGVFLGCFLLITLDLIATFLITALTASSVSMECNDVLPFSRPKRSDHRAFTARVIRAGHQVKYNNRWIGEWAIAEIEEKFWGLPRWTPRYVLLTDDVFWEGETYFIDGRRAQRLLPHFLPVVVAGPCGRTRPLTKAAVDLHVIRKASASSGARIVGYVQYEPTFVPPYLKSPSSGKPVVGARIKLTSKSGTRTAFTDTDGVYEFDGLVPDDYDVTLAFPNSGAPQTIMIGKDTLSSYKIMEADFPLYSSGAPGSEQ